MLAPDANSGLICGFVARPDGALEQVGWDQMAARLADPARPVWLHFNLSDRRSQRFISELTLLPQHVRAFLLEREGRVRIEPLGGGLVGALADIRFDTSEEITETALFRFYCGEHFVISTRTRPLQTLDRLRVAMEADGRFAGTTDLLVQLLHQFELTFAGRLAELDLHLDKVEDSILLERGAQHGAELGQLRRDLAHLRRHIHPQRQAIATAVNKLPGWAADGASRLREATEALAAQAQELDHMQESARLLQDELASRLAETTARNLYFLSVATAIFLPMTLVTGIFGMNVAGMPWLEDPAGFWIVMGVLAFTGLLALVVLRMKRLI